MITTNLWVQPSPGASSLLTSVKSKLSVVFLGTPSKQLVSLISTRCPMLRAFCQNKLNLLYYCPLFRTCVSSIEYEITDLAMENIFSQVLGMNLRIRGPHLILLPTSKEFLHIKFHRDKPIRKMCVLLVCSNRKTTYSSHDLRDFRNGVIKF